MQLARVEGQNFYSVAQIAGFLSAVDVENRYMLQREIANQMMEQHAQMGDQLVQYYIYVEHDRSWQAIHSQEEFNSKWKQIQQKVRDIQSKQSKIEQTRRDVVED
jgi:hypothetical protein